MVDGWKVYKAQGKVSKLAEGLEVNPEHIDVVLRFKATLNLK